MKRITLTVAAVLVAAIPATMGLVGNTSFAQSVPVPVPLQVTVTDDKGMSRTHLEPGDDNSGKVRKIEKIEKIEKSGKSAKVEPTDNRGDKGGLSTHVEPGDDKGGLSTHVEPGDDKGGLSTHIEPGDDKASDGGSGRVDKVEPRDNKVREDKVSDSGSGKVDNGGDDADKVDGSGHS
jgi:hypothetical protein